MERLMAKHIIFCADGTWNTVNPDAETPPQDATNVFKLFNLLQGSVIPSTVKREDSDIVEIEKAKTTGAVLQVAKYINGVGNSQSKIKRLFGGGFGAGLVQRIVRGYTFISRNYEPGDKIVIVGFSRGAYTARALAGMIASQGLLSQHFNRGSVDAYKRGTQAWYRYRKSVKAKGESWLPDFATAILNLDVWDFISDDLTDADFIPVDIEAVAVWDTVGSMGIPKYDVDDNQMIDTFRFADVQLSPKVKHGLHAIALDEQRILFSPTLWEAAPNVKQMVFPGGHSDVGGGYKEKGLSDAALVWILQELAQLQVQLSDWTALLRPNPSAPAHQEWRALVGHAAGVRPFGHVPQLGRDASIQARMALPSVVHHRDEKTNQDFDIKPYRPQNLPPLP
jgi:uncharacterized protein (DUF2235 family)